MAAYFRFVVPDTLICEGRMKEEDDDLEREAVEELLKEAKRGKDRAETMGAMGWMKCPLASTNKRFLINTIKTTLPPDREKHSRTTEEEEEEEEDTKDPDGKQRHSEKHGAHPYRRREDSRKEKRRSPSLSRSRRHR
ncbi:protein POLR1D [Hyla sarda]|uniref:protein POLR1D n=1 Tax=Hyla sarda TaxID=327740 RepID=UPI0024C311D2|nr:protein POLR1D [Hyla sarda]